MSREGSGPGTRRAPRLGPDERIGPHITRRGRFLRLDPLSGRPLPGVAKVVGAVGWAGLVAYAFGRAVRGSRAGDRED